MAEPLMRAVPLLFPLREGERREILHEPVIGSVIPDILIGTWFGSLPRFDKMTSITRHVIAYLARESAKAHEEQLCRDLFLSECAAGAAIGALVKAGAVQKYESGEVQLQKAFDPRGDVHLIAVELKMKRWREALEQAAQYRRFVDEAYVVLDGNQVTITDEICATFRSQGVGLLLQRGWFVKPAICAEPMEPPLSSDRLLAFTKLAKADVF